MKILQVISSFPPAYAYGGALKVAFELSRELAKDNYDVTVYTTDVFDADTRLHYTSNPEIMDGITVFRFRNISNWLSRKNFTCAPFMFIFLKKRIREFDIIHLHEYRSFQAMFVHHYAKKYHIPYIVQAHGAVLPHFEKQGVKKIFDRLWGNKILKDATKLIALTETESEQYQSMGVPKSKIEIIPNGIDVSQFSNLPKKGEFRSKFHIPETDRVILYLGRIHRIKGIDLLISAYPALLKEFPDARLVIAGPDDNYLPAIEDQIRQLKISTKPLFTGALYGKEKLAAYVDADIFVLPSHYEAFPMTILEAMACGVPIVTTVKRDVLAWVDNNVGFVVDYEKSSLTEAIAKILRDLELAKKFGHEGRKLVQERFIWKSHPETTGSSPKDIISQLEELYQRYGKTL